MLNLVIFGAPGSGKGTQSERITKKYGLKHISTGEVLRDHIARGTELGKLADSIISKGNLIPDELMLKVLEHTLDSDPDAWKNGVVFDGFPRTIPQAKALKKLLNDRNTDLHGVVGLEVPEDELVDRMLQRGLREGRADDNLDTIKTRLKVYHDRTSPLKDYYTNEGIYHPINGSGNVEKIFGDLSTSLENLRKEYSH